MMKKILVSMMMLFISLKLPVQGDEVTWITPGAGSWTNSANWNSGVPLAGDDVMIALSGALVELPETTPQLSSITVESGTTLVFTNWTTALRATNVWIKNLGVVTCAGSFTNADAMNRVWIEAGHFEIASGGSINVTQKGFASQSGPGAGNNSQWVPSAGSHGGIGGNQLIRTYQGNLCYGSLEAPVLPGSGGGTSGSVVTGSTRVITGGAGGGAVCITADTVVVNGTIDARGESETVKYSQRSGGAGGSIFIQSQTFQSTGGVLDARGGGTAENGSGTGTGGGGRIAVRYNVAAQALEVRPSVTLDARAGAVWDYVGAKEYPGDPGTIFLEDYSFLPTTGNFPSIQGLLYSAAAARWDADSLTISGKEIGFRQEGIHINVSNDLVVTAGGKLSVGGSVVTNWFVTAISNAGGDGWERRRMHTFGATAIPPVLDVGGSLKIEQSSALRLFSADGAQTATGAVLHVAKDIDLLSASGIFLASHPRSGASPRLSMRNLTVASNAFISAEGTGCSGSRFRRYGYGQGSGRGEWKIANGGSYGGLGGFNTSSGTTPAATYGVEQAPEHCGSGGGVENYFSGDGGGLIHIVAAQAVLIEGILNANGTSGFGHNANNANGGGGSGGGIYIRCTRFAGTGGRLWANGAASANTEAVGYPGSSGGGGGGRIAVWRTYDRSSEIEATATGGASVSGVSSSGEVFTYDSSTDGTVFWGLLPQPCTVLTIR